MVLDLVPGYDPIRPSRGCLMSLMQCVYSSMSVPLDFPRAALDALLEQCRRSNAAADVTGMLLYERGSFFQILEGEPSVVTALFEKISQDQRHTRTKKILEGPILLRAFGEWTMGFPNIRAAELARIPGLNDFFLGNQSFLDIGEGRAKLLVAAFKDGRWRASLR